MYREITVGELIELLKMFPEDSKVSNIEGDDEYLWVGGIAIELYIDNPKNTDKGR